jgi:hypothetical protein
MQCRGQLPFQMFGDREHLRFIGATNDHRRGAEHLVHHVCMLQQIACADREQCCTPAVLALRLGATRQQRHLVVAEQMLDALLIGGVDAGSQHDAGRHLSQRGTCRGDEPFEICAVERNRQAGVRAELPTPSVSEATNSWPSFRLDPRARRAAGTQD